MALPCLDGIPCPQHPDHAHATSLQVTATSAPAVARPGTTDDIQCDRFYQGVS